MHEENMEDPVFRRGHGEFESGQKFYDPDLNRATESDGHVQELASRVSEKKLMAKIDFRLIPVLSVMYLLACKYIIFFGLTGPY